MAEQHNSGFPCKPYINTVSQDSSVMHYVRDGEFGMSDIGATSEGMAKSIKTERMTIQHVGNKT